MSIKKNIKQIQEEFKGDEKILENAFRLERLYKKYKYFLFAIIIALIVWFVYAKFSSYNAEKQAQQTTTIYNKLLKNPNNQALLDELKNSSRDLYNLYEYAQALKDGDKQTLQKLSESKNIIIKNLATYQYASYSEDPEKLESMSKTPMKDLAILQAAYLLDKQNKIIEARTLLDQIDRISPTYQIASILKHYGVEKNISIPASPTNLNQKNTEEKSDKK
ncbi:hypothetical protein [Helicobacter sp. 11S03491-1]|uniref:hypothetical protein n=1 Tax=Helicobacter sp. 11S03491-1 TaxID=1476196 RepID=UPI000BA7943C|nr:hypothetical protein [Helicobacter sp. 11S03491-1]PAF42257.1 hypothetical protein BKH45_04750 [Helicobacter sp. 11S03491-1]